MAKYHITKSGKPSLCRASLRACPLGKHYNTKEEASDALQTEMSEEYGMLSRVDEDVVQLKKKYKEQYKIIKEGGFKSIKEEEQARTHLAKLSRKIKGEDNKVENLNDLFKDIRKPDGGATISISTNNNQSAIIPTVGFCASPYPQHSKVFDTSKDVNHSSILEFMINVEKENQDIFSDDETYVGLWNDPKTGKIYLDISKRYHTAQEARIACEENDQIAYFDLQTYESIDVDRSATSGQKKE